MQSPLTRCLTRLAEAALQHKAERTTQETDKPEDGDATFDAVFTIDRRAMLFREQALVIGAECGIDVCAPLYPSEDHEQYHVDLTLTVESKPSRRPDYAAQEREDVARDERHEELMAVIHDVLGAEMR